MSTQLSVVALVIASYTFWTQPPALELQQVGETTGLPQPAEFSCQARCPSPAPAVAVAYRASGSSSALVFIAGFCCCLAFFLTLWQRARVARAQPQQVFVEHFAPPGPRDREPLVALRGPLTPARRRELRALREDAA